MKKMPIRARTLALFAIILPLLALFIYVGLRSGPLAPVAVTITTVTSEQIKPALFGIGTVEARYTYKIGPTFAGRIKDLNVHVGDKVTAGQIIGQIDAIDLEDKIRSQEASLKRAQAIVDESTARHAYAQTQARRYEKLFANRAVSQEESLTKTHELKIATTALNAAQQERVRAVADLAALKAQHHSLRLIAPADGIVTLRDANPGTTIVAGQTIIETIDPTSLWINVRFDQSSASGLSANLVAQINLRSRSDENLSGTVLRVEPKADAITEEILAKVVFDTMPQPLPPLGELTEVTIYLPALKASPSISNSSLRKHNGKMGVWKVTNGDLAFTPIKLGAANLEGLVQVQEGLAVGDQIVLYSEKILTEKSRIHIVDHIAGVL